MCYDLMIRKKGMKNIVYFPGTCILLFFLGFGFHPVTAQPESLTGFGKTAWQESVVPIRPGKPGEKPFWNEYARQFIYAPAFDFKKTDDAVKYRFEIVSEATSKKYQFEDRVPYAPLSQVWKEMPVGQYSLKVVGISHDGDTLGTTGEKSFYRAAPFNGIYHEAVIPYDQSAGLALERLMNKDYVAYWFTHKVPDPTYINYRYPAKIYSALLIGALTYARLKQGTYEAEHSVQLARIIADYMLDIRFKEGTPWEYFVPTYYGEHAENATKQHLKPINNFSIMGVDAGNAFLDMYDYLGEERYLKAAKQIADTYLKRQLENGSWYQFVNHETGVPTAENIVIPTSIINYFDRLRNDYGVKGLEKATARAFDWIMDNPVKTWNWQAQFEDVVARPPYQNLSREQACDLAVYLFRNKKNNQLAEELVRFSEDQFIIWEKPVPVEFQERKGGSSEDWITPSVQEQYVFWMPVGRAAGIMLETYWEAYLATKKEIYLAKAKSIANTFTLVQQENQGDYPTFFTKYPMNLWLNSTVYPAKIMMRFKENLRVVL
jgi:hypothetical protein